MWGREWKCRQKEQYEEGSQGCSPFPCDHLDLLHSHGAILECLSEDCHCPHSFSLCIVTCPQAHLHHALHVDSCKS